MTNAIYGQIILYFFGLVPLAGDNWGLMIQFAFTKGAIYFYETASGTSCRRSSPSACCSSRWS